MGTNFGDWHQAWSTSKSLTPRALAGGDLYLGLG